MFYETIYNLYITYIHFSYRETVHKHFFDVDINLDIQNTIIEVLQLLHWCIKYIAQY